jgi:hypothetical protein
VLDQARRDGYEQPESQHVQEERDEDESHSWLGVSHGRITQNLSRGDRASARSGE